MVLLPAAAAVVLLRLRARSARRLVRLRVEPFRTDRASAEAVVAMFEALHKRLLRRWWRRLVPTTSKPLSWHPCRHKGCECPCFSVASGQATPQLRAALADLGGRARAHLRQAQDRITTASPAIMPAFLPIALAGPTLARMERRDYDPFVPVEIAPWRRQWLLWRASRQPARILC